MTWYELSSGCTSPWPRGRVATAIESAGPGSPEAQRRIANILRYSRIELVLLLGLVFMMVVKLGT